MENGAHEHLPRIQGANKNLRFFLIIIIIIIVKVSALHLCTEKNTIHNSVVQRH